MESGDNLQMACELIDPGGPAEPSEVTAKPKKERKDLFQINTHPGSHISANNKRDRRLKKIVMRVVEFCKKEHEEGLQIPFRFFKKRASVMTGVSLSTIHRIETIDMKEQSPEPKSKPKPKKEGEKKKKKKKTSDTSSQDEAASQPKKKRVRKKKEKTEAEVPQDAHNIMLNSTNPNAAVAGTSTNIQNNVVGTVAATADLISMQPPQHSFAVAPGSVTTVVTTININNQGAGGAGPQDGRGGCGWTAGPVGPFTMGELRDGTVPVDLIFDRS
nr:hypothetical protein BaRGS_015886 [Batillaria attramentaria]